MKIICIYPGRFQPFGRHHKAAFDWLCSKFGAENCHVCTSDKVSNDSPLNFDEKARIIRKFEVNNIIKSSSPYRPVDIASDPDNTALIVMLGQKDAGRIKYTKADGTPGYYCEYYGQKELEPMSKRGYVVTAPHISITHNGNELSGTYLRTTLPEAPQSTFSELMGWYDQDVQKMLCSRLGASTGALQTKRHISHIWELDIDEICEVVNGLVSGNIHAYEKVDGINLKVSNKNKSLVVARNKSDLIKPISPSDLIDRYMDRPNLVEAFGWGMLEVSKNLAHLDPEYWYNIEIVHPMLNSVFKYEKPMVIVHDICKYDVNGEMIERSIPKKSFGTLMSPNRIIIPRLEMYAATLKSWLRRQTDLESAVNQIAFTLLSKVSGYLATESDINTRLSDVNRKMTGCTDSVLRSKYFNNLERLDTTKILPFEGIVFDYKDRTYKLTGQYRYVNQILHIMD